MTRAWFLSQAIMKLIFILRLMQSSMCCWMPPLAPAGYQACIVVIFLAALPLNILLSSIAATVATLVCAGGPTQQGQGAAAVAVAGPGAAEATKPSEDLVALAKAAAPASPSASQAATSPAASSSSSGSESKVTSAASSSSSGADASATSSSSGAGSEAGQQGSAASNAGSGSTAGSSTAAEGQSPPQPAKPGLVASIRQGLKEVKARLPQASAMVKRVWWVPLFWWAGAGMQGLMVLIRRSGKGEFFKSQKCARAHQLVVSHTDTAANQPSQNRS